MRETIRLTPSPFQTSGPVVEYDVETWYCCRPWPIVVASTMYSGEWPKRETWWVRKCGICRQYPRPEENGVLG